MTVARRWLPILLAPLAAGCQAGVTQGPADHARSALQSFLIACSADHPVAASEILTPEARRGFAAAGGGLEGCVKLLGLATPDASLTPLQRRDLLERTKVAGVQRGHGNQYKTVTLETPDGKPHAVEASQRGTLWEIESGSFAPQRSDQAAGAAHAAESLLDACSHEDTKQAAGELASDERDAFRKDAKAADTSTACVTLLGLTTPAEHLTKAEREDELDRTELSSVDRATHDRYAVDLQAPDGRRRELDATLTGGQWLLSHPEDDALKGAAQAFLRACAAGDTEGAAGQLASSAQDGFRKDAEHGKTATACLKLTGIKAKKHESATAVVQALDVAGLDKRSNDAYAITLAGSDDRKGELEATKSGDSWKLAKAS